MKNYWLDKKEEKLHERWQRPSDDECGWVPIRPAGAQITSDGFFDLSQVMSNGVCGNCGATTPHSCVKLDLPPTIEITPIPSFNIIMDVPSVIQFDVSQIPSLIVLDKIPDLNFKPIEFTPPTITVDWGAPPQVSCVVIVTCPSYCTPKWDENDLHWEI